MEGCTKSPSILLTPIIALATGETVSGTKHHVYTNMVDKTKGAEAMPIHHPTYHQALKNKAADGVAKYRRSYFD